MIAPVARFLNEFRQQHPWAAQSLVSLLGTCLFSVALLVLYFGACRLLQPLATRQALRAVFCRFSIALLPLGLSIWLGHLAFHLASSLPSIPALLAHLSAQFSPAHSLAAQHLASMPRKLVAASSSSMFTPLLGPNGWNLFDLQVWIVNLGLFVSWYAGRKVIHQMADTSRRIWTMSAVWVVSSTALYALAVWIFTQPMYMRGMSM